MNPNTLNNQQGDALDVEIERDVAELNSLLAKIDEQPTEPHPAYWQNFLPRVHQRIEAEQKKKFRWRPAAWVPAIGTAVVVLVVGTVFWPRGGGDDSSQPRSGSNTNAPAKTAESGTLYSSDQQANSLILSKGEVKMLDAIMSDDDNALFSAVADDN